MTTEQKLEISEKCVKELTQENKELKSKQNEELQKKFEKYTQEYDARIEQLQVLIESYKTKERQTIIMTNEYRKALESMSFKALLKLKIQRIFNK